MVDSPMMFVGCGRSNKTTRAIGYVKYTLEQGKADTVYCLVDEMSKEQWTSSFRQDIANVFIKPIEMLEKLNWKKVGPRMLVVIDECPGHELCISDEVRYRVLVLAQTPFKVTTTKTYWSDPFDE